MAGTPLQTFDRQPAIGTNRFEGHWLQLELQGFTCLPNAMRPELLQACREYFDTAVARAGRLEPPPVGSEDEGIVGMFLDPAENPIFGELFDHPLALPLVERAMRERTRCARYPDGEEPTLLDMNDGQYMPARCGVDFAVGKNMGWHPDGEYVRLTYLLDDMEPEGGGTAFFAGSHRAAAREGERLVNNANAEGGVGSGVPEWLNAPGPAGHGPGTWLPVDAPGVWRAEGPAGSVIVNYTMTWHTRTPNYSDLPRRIIWIVYKRASEPQPSRYPSVPQGDGLGWGESKKQWADYAHGLAVGDPKRKLCGLDMEPSVSLDYRKRDGRWVPLESVSKL